MTGTPGHGARSEHQGSCRRISQPSPLREFQILVHSVAGCPVTPSPNGDQAPEIGWERALAMSSTLGREDEMG